MTWYDDIRARALRGQYLEPITWSEVMAYRQFLAMSGVQMEAFDCEMLCRLDSAWMGAQPEPGSSGRSGHKKTRQARGGKRAKPNPEYGTPWA